MVAIWFYVGPDGFKYTVNGKFFKIRKISGTPTSKLSSIMGSDKVI
jgi:hypothetical protein